MKSKSVIDERQKTHGNYADVAKVAWSLKLHRGKIGFRFFQSEALDMICVKMARIICGDHNHVDHWRDIAGYAELVVRELENKQGG